MASTAHSDPEMMKEHRDPPDVLARKMEKLAELVQASKHFVVFTGAGISTSAGIPDFRGPDGKWTRQAQGKAPITGVQTVKAFPTPTHMSLVVLHARGVVKYVISQNCDGLHRRSGLPASGISELHGNGNVEVCEDCGQHYFRDFRCDRLGRGRDHFTGRLCRCDGRLLNSTIDFGQNLPVGPLEKAREHSDEADLHLVLGSSLTVSPANTMPENTATKKGGTLVICNLQRTPLTDLAAFQIHAETDTVMRMLMERLGIPVPSFRLLRRVLLGVTEIEIEGRRRSVGGGGYSGGPGGSSLSRRGSSDRAAAAPARKRVVFAKAVDVHDPTLDLGLLWAVDWAKTDSATGKKGTTSEQDRRDAVAAGHGMHYRSIEDGKLDLADVRATLHFMGHYNEPPVELGADLSSASASSPAATQKDFLLSFDPIALKWALVENPEDEPLLNAGDYLGLEQGMRERAIEKPDKRIGRSHRDYCVKGVMKSKGLTKEAAEETVDRMFRESRAKVAVGGAGGVPERTDGPWACGG